MNKSFGFTIALLAASILIGCGDSRSVEGDWKVTGLQTRGLPAGTNLDFKMNFKNPSAKLTVTGSAEAMGQKFDLDLSAPATFALEGDRLKLTFTDFQINTENEAVMTIIKAGLSKDKDRVITSMNANASGKVTWISADKFTVDATTGVVTYERIPSK